MFTSTERQSLRHEMGDLFYSEEFQKDLNTMKEEISSEDSLSVEKDAGEAGSQLEHEAALLYTVTKVAAKQKRSLKRDVPLTERLK